MALGKPVIANNHPEQSLVISTSKGGICVPYDIEAFASAIIDLASDPDMVKQMGKAGKKYVKNHRTYSIIANNIEHQYKDLLY